MAGKDLVVIPPRPVGRQTVYTQEAADEVLERLADGELLIEICLDDHLPKASTVSGWVYDDDGRDVPWKGFAARYARARSIGVERELEEIRQLSDTPVLATQVELTVDAEGVQQKKIKRGDALGHRALQIDARKWRVSKMAWRYYGTAPGGSGGPTDGEGETVKIEGGLPDDEA